jgi:hypothetical protein
LRRAGQIHRLAELPSSVVSNFPLAKTVSGHTRKQPTSKGPTMKTALQNARSSNTAKKAQPHNGNGSKKRPVIFPMPCALQKLVIAGDDSLFELLAEAPGVQIFKDEEDRYLIDREISATIKTDGSMEYSLLHERCACSREFALLNLLLSAVPEEFRDLLQPVLGPLKEVHHKKTASHGPRLSKAAS